MAIPVYLQQFKAAGIYRVVFEKSTVEGVDSEILRLVVGYSEKGPFNIPVYITSISEFKAMYGDISKKLEKRGVYFHRIALQALAKGPILALNLKRFDGETVSGATINTDFNPVFDPIDTVTLNVEDIYDTSRFWELSAEKLIDLKAVDGSIMDQYINISATNTSNLSGTYFIRKAAGTKVNGYNLTISDWYSDGVDELPEYLENYRNSLVSDFFAEVYVFSGKFSASQVLASSTLKKYFESAVDAATGKPTLDENGETVLKLKQYVTNAFGDSVDTLDELYNDETSGAIGHYVGCLIPGFKNKQGSYVALDILFNTDQEEHNMMMAFNTDLLEQDGTAHIDLSGRLSIPTDTGLDTNLNITNISLDKLFNGTASTTLLGNTESPVITDRLTFSNNIVKYTSSNNCEPIIPFKKLEKRVSGTLVVSNMNSDATTNTIDLKQVTSTGTPETVTIKLKSANELWETAVKLGCAYTVSNPDNAKYTITHDDGTSTYYAPYLSGWGTMYSAEDPFITPASAEGEHSTFNGVGPQRVITSISRLEPVAGGSDYNDNDMNMKVTLQDVTTTTLSYYGNNSTEDGDTWAIYGSSISFIPASNAWEQEIIDGSYAFVSDSVTDSTIYSFLQVGDCLLAEDGSTDRDNNGIIDEWEGKTDNFYDNVYVQSIEAKVDDNGNITKYVIKLTGEPLIYTANGTSYLVRVDRALNQEIGTMIPQYLKGYTYKNTKPASTTMYDKLKWQKFILSTLTDYKGLRTALLNKSDIDYRYIVDTFESYVDNEIKSIFSLLAKEKQSTFAILNFPAVRTFVKCPYASFTDSKGVFNVQYIVDGYNRKKATTVQFSLPSESNGASFCAFYTPVKFSDGYVDAIVPSAGLVSNLFMEKYLSREPFYIIAGPNYGNIAAQNLVGPDYNYSLDELQIIEPYGVNCMVYRPNFGTFINANQTAKQTPVSPLSKVNIRELVIYLQDEIEKLLQAYQWEFNNPTTRQAIKDKADVICSRVQALGGLQTFKNVMDSSNNTNEIIDNEMAILSTHIEPGFGCGKMVQELTLYRTGQMSSFITD